MYELSLIHIFGMSPAYLLMLGVMMNLCLTPLSVLGMMIAEEKEKNTCLLYTSRCV